MRMRLLPLLLLLASVTACGASPLPGITGRKIGPLRVGNIGHWGMMVSRDDRFLAFGWDEEGTGARCSFFDRRTHAFWTPDIEMLPLAFSRDGREMFVWCNEEPLPGLEHQSKNDFYIAVYNPARRRFTRIFPDLHAPDNLDYLASGLVSRDGKTLTFVSQEGRVHAFDTRTGHLKWRSHLPALSQSNEEEPGFPVLNGDGTRVLQNRDEATAQTTQVVDTRSGKVLARLRLNYRNPNAMRPVADEGRLAPRGSMAATFFPGTQQWVFWNTHTNRVCWKMGGPSRVTTGDLSWQFSPDGRAVAVFGPQGLEVRDARTGHIWKRNAQLSAGNVAFSPDGKRLYAIGDGNGFEGDQVLWQWRILGTKREFRLDAFVGARQQRREERFALSPRHLNESLVQAARKADAARVALLLNRGARIDTLDGRGETLLENAINVYGGADFVQRSRATVKLLIARGANINARGSSVLASAAAGDFALTKFLLEHGARVNGDASAYGTSTALFAATEFGQFDSAKLLLEHGAQVNALDENGCTPLMQAIEHNGSVGSSRSDSKKLVALVRLLLDHGADVNARDKQGEASLGETVLGKAARWDNAPPLIQLLLERGAHPNECDKDGNTALMNAVAGYDPRDDFPDPQGEKNVISIIQLLVSHSANINARNKANQAALSLAKSPSIKAVLQKAGAKP